MDRHTKVVKREDLEKKTTEPPKPPVDKLSLINDALTGMESNFSGQSRSFRTHVLNTLLDMNERLLDANERLSRLETGG